MRKTTYVLLAILLLVGVFFAGRYFSSNGGSGVANLLGIKPIDHGPILENNNTTTEQPIVQNENTTGNVNWIDPIVMPNDYSVLSDFWQTTDGKEMLNTFKKENLKYKVGTIPDGKYAGKDVMLMGIPPDGPGGIWYHYAIQDKEKYIFIVNVSLYSSYWDKNITDSQIKEKFSLSEKNTSIERNFIFSDLELPKTIQSVVGSNAQNFTLLDRRGEVTNSFFKDLKNLKKVFNNNQVGDVYIMDPSIDSDKIGPFFRTNDTGGSFIVKRKDGQIGLYTLRIPFIDSSTNKPSIIWNNKSRNIETYSFVDYGGCGVTNHTSVVNDVITIDDLIIAGVDGDYAYGGDPIYELKDRNHHFLKDLYNGIYKDPNNPITYEQMLADHPLFFWVDPYGRIIKFSNSKYIPAVECGKPVIYLYPTHDMNVNVKVAPKGGFSFTEPNYDAKTGWNVFTTTQSVITDLRDNKTYPYLFWEGRGGLYQTPEKGWSVARDDVPNFINQKLTTFGLNKKEIADFSEFWLPKMKNAPYYFITFMGNQTMNDIAPLNITPRPDTTIRVLMDYKELQTPIDVTGFSIRTPERKGFTVVEWGGVLK